jgi:hypothetical protein
MKALRIILSCLGVLLTGTSGFMLLVSIWSTITVQMVSPNLVVYLVVFPIGLVLLLVRNKMFRKEFLLHVDIVVKQLATESDPLNNEESDYAAGYRAGLQAVCDGLRKEETKNEST